jgi:hypothetical protein
MQSAVRLSPLSADIAELCQLIAGSNQVAGPVIDPEPGDSPGLTLAGFQYHL